MAVLAMEKIQLLGLKKDLKKVLEMLQKGGMMQVEEIVTPKEISSTLEALTKEEHEADLMIAHTDFVIRLLTPYAKKRPVWAGKPTLTEESALGTLQNFHYKNAIKAIQRAEEKHVAATNALNALTAEEAILKHWTKLPFDLNIERHTAHAQIFIGDIPKIDYEALVHALKWLSKLVEIDKINEDESTCYSVIVVGKAHLDAAKLIQSQYKFTEAELPTHAMSVKERLQVIHEEKATHQKTIEEIENDYRTFAKDFENFQIVHDVFVWQRDEQQVKEKLRGTAYSFIITGWIAKLDLKKLEQQLADITSHTAIATVKPEEGEESPILLHNHRTVWPFESVTKLYGFPLANEVDPTPFLATFFIVFFALCLTDAGYGLLLFLIMFIMLKFFNLPKESTGLIRLLMWGGVLTMIAGYFFGGYFGLTVEQAPAFMVDGDMFKGQVINAAAGSGPLTFLILAVILGIVQVIVGKLIDGWWKIKQNQYWDALFDSFLWIYFLLAIMAFGLASNDMLIPNDYAELTKWLTLGGVGAMILTQGRKQKGFVSKLGMGILSLYGLVGYLGDILSYSRIMALGLATGIIAFAMNIIAQLAYDLIPYVGIVAALIVLVLGHLMNLVLSALGAFIHSARLQFVEFFSKFMEGGGSSFKPFKRMCKYIVIT